MLPNCFSVHSNMAPAAQVRRSERNGGRQRCGQQRDEKQSVSRSPSFLLFPCDGCKAVDHVPALSVFLIKILYLKAHGREGGGKKKGGKLLGKHFFLCEGGGRGHHTAWHTQPIQFLRMASCIDHPWTLLESKKAKDPKGRRASWPSFKQWGKGSFLRSCGHVRCN